MGAVLVPDGYHSMVLSRWDKLTVELGRTPGDVLHWVNIKSHGQRLHVANVLAGLDRAHLGGVVFSKWDTPNTNHKGVRQPDFLYNWLLRLMLERLSWFARNRRDTVRPVFAQVRGLDPRKLHSYMTRLRGLETTIAWNSLHLPAVIDTPKNRRVLQVADAFCGMINSAFEWDAYGSSEARYLEVVRPRMWRSRAGKLASYGMKISPLPHPRHTWAEDFCNRP